MKPSGYIPKRLSIPDADYGREAHAESTSDAAKATSAAIPTGPMLGLVLSNEALNLADLFIGQLQLPANRSVMQGDVFGLRAKNVNVLRSVVVPDSIQVVDDFTFKQGPPKFLLCDDDASSNVAASLSSWMIGHSHQDVAGVHRQAAIPSVGTFSAPLEFGEVVLDEPPAWIDWLPATAQANGGPHRPDRTTAGSVWTCPAEQSGYVFIGRLR